MIFGYIDPGTGYTIGSIGGLLIAFLSGVLGAFLLFFKRFFKFFKKNKSWVIIGALLLLAGAIVALVLLKNNDTMDFEQKIVILGLDALSPRIMEPMMEKGRLPNFSRLQETGSFHPLATTNPPQSPVAWSAFATGQNPGKNGIFDFITRNPQDYSISLSLSHLANGKPKTVIKTPRFWQYLNEKNIPSVILGCPMTFPPDPVQGKMISGMGVPDILGTEGTFSFYTSQKEEKSETTGGKIFYVKKSPMILSHLIGPKVQKMNGKVESTKVPFKLTIQDSKTLNVELQKQKKTLKVGQWSDWQEVTFDLGFFRKMKGIFQFYLVEVEPELKLYISPINLDPRDPYFQISHPRNYSRQIAEELGLYRTQGMPFDTWALNEKRLDEDAFIAQATQVLQERERLLDLELSRFEKGLFYFYFESPDIIQHMFWRYIDPQHPLYEQDAPQKYKEIIYQWYEKMDKILGKVMQKIDPQDTLIVLSDHGFDTFRRAAHTNSWLRDNGYLELKDPGAMEGEPLLSSIDWTKTKAYSLGFGAVYINEKGRESQGIVNPGSEKEQLKSEIAQKLEQWIDPKFKANVVKKAYKQEEVFWGKYQNEAPDIVVGFNSGYRASWQTALGAVPKNTIEDNLRKWSGSHLMDARLVDGVLFSNRLIMKNNPAIIDIAPTVLSIVGFEPDELSNYDLDGETLF